MSVSAPRTTAVITRPWDRLDNAGKLYPSLSTQKWSSLFRVAAVMKHDVDPQLLQEAVDRVLPRFPTITTQLAAGFYWYYLKNNPKRLLVEPDLKFPCSPIHWRRKNAHLLRVLYGERRIALDFFHAVTDGAGALIFLKTLVAEYLRLNGIDVPATLGVLDLNTPPRGEEMSDAFLKLPLPKSKGIKAPGRAYRFPVKKDKFVAKKHIHTYLVSVSELKAKAQKHNLTINEYLTAIFLYVGVQEQLKHKPLKLHPIRVSVPVNMRRYYETSTLRNFSTFVTPEIRPPFTKLTFEIIAEQVRAYMKEALQVDNLYEAIAPNVALEKNIASRLTPLFIKNFLIQVVYRLISSKSTTTTLTNLGIFTAPQQLMDELETVEVMLGPAQRSGIGAAILTTKDTIRIAFTSTQVHPVLPEAVEVFFSEHGITTQKEVISE